MEMAAAFTYKRNVYQGFRDIRICTREF